ncbi:siroheme synthase CysG [Yoonia sediminilitoris]|uniref:Uroporphyrin-III C-methyltransferase/precorrin-2 dehydrogenase/sirohydrochlorin ferrochelatase n=1 Tax=Yoonia sediminilitoris TaxID=1286148 RepID=A0A2T6KRB7_9RHOB|nr:siroheme synthase CysG [Yoonia sediminilitoris]PUB19099.1 uroporphyrin-III C-methyltransferase/precorrin-2 dehydrogenase/sirohydrochlorin ferrochelatase [Yoonia sediminilitoris]RCW99267.1 uroporphyrin-III C-methyltransferase/precorrin-2 dehydrogenase/sirohydrochlorin ferrochelatase [Yoonia sediminilitoris]
MKHFPIFLAVAGRRIVLSGGGDAAMAKLRLLMKTEAKLTVIAAEVAPEIHRWAADGKLKIVKRAMEPGDALCAALFYAANEDDAEDARVSRIAHADGALVNIVDNLADSQFITPAIVDRDPVTVAIGTEGAAPVLARAIKADLEARLPSSLGVLARIGKSFRQAVDALPMGRKRRDFWSAFYFNHGPKAFEKGGEAAVLPSLKKLLDRHIAGRKTDGHVDLVGAGPGDPELLTLKARNALDKADVVIHDRLVTPEILELARREAIVIDAGKEGFGTSMAQADIDALIVQHALDGHHVVRLKSGDPTVFGRLDEEIAAIEAHDISYRIIPGITAASAAVATIGQSLTKRHRNSAVRLITGHDTKGYADQDWQALAAAGEVAAIYMGKKSARFIQGRLLMHGADPATPVTIIENVSRADQQIIATTLAELEPTLTQANLQGPAITFYGLAPRAALSQAEKLKEFA